MPRVHSNYENRILSFLMQKPTCGYVIDQFCKGLGDFKYAPKYMYLTIRHLNNLYKGFYQTMCD